MARKLHFNTFSPDTLVIATSCTALFDLRTADNVFHQHGLDKYREHQLEHENDILEPGPSFPLIKKLLNINNSNDEPLVEVILLSRNSADTGLRVFNSIEHYGLNIRKAAFTSGKSPYRYIDAFGAHLFLSTKVIDVKSALSAGCAGATLRPSSAKTSQSDKIKIAFDGDSVLFSDEAERISQTQGLEAFAKNERDSAKVPLSDGPFKKFLDALCRLQKHFPENDCPIQTALVTAREAPAHERVIRTLRSWNVRLDEAMFLGGLNKTEFLRSFDADIFFDDQPRHCESAHEHVTAAHVPHGVVNE
jgi:5'-nucleotidase